MSARPKPVSSFLAASPHASALRHVDLGFGRSATIWRNQDDHVTYDAPDGHTFSFYIRGGMGTRRIDAGAVHGWPGAVCVMPHGQTSEWDITDPFEFVHLYLPDGELRRVFAETFDRDARLMEMADLTYTEAPELTGPFQTLIAAMGADDPLMAEGAMADLLASVFASGRFCAPRRAGLAGGLAPHKLRQLRDFIEAHLDRTIRLQDLAELAGLSEFHLQRSFRASCGVSPHQWIAHRRIERAKDMIRAGDPLAQVAQACGYGSQSYLTRAFKAATGVTPSAYRAGG